MPTVPKPRILILDDHPDEARVRGIEIGNRAYLEIAHPADVTEDELAAADLVLVDFRLDAWPDRENVSSIALKPMNGLALAAVLRSQLHDNEAISPTAFALYSARLDELSGRLPPEPRAHAIARAHNLEWVFSKRTGQNGIPLTQQWMALASAVRRLPSSWPIDNEGATEEQVKELLSLPLDRIWSGKAWEDIKDSYPPIHELSRWSHGLAVLRWLLHRILPYPCFLIDSHYLAARTRVAHSSLLQDLQSNGGLAQLFDSVLYRGVLSEFMDTRWWRTGVESVLWEVTSGQSSDPEIIRSVLSTQSKVGPHFLDIMQPVVCLDSDYQPLGDAVEIGTAVRIQPDDWPPYADQAWTTIELAKKEHALAALILRKDMPRLK